MVTLASLWLPIVLSAVAVFVASSVIWMALPYHKSDWKKLPNQDAVQSTLRSGNLSRGMYMFPWCTHEDMKKPEMQAQLNQGPWGSITLLTTKPNMGRMMPLWLLHLVVVSVIVAYVEHVAFGATKFADGEAFRQVFRVGATTAWVAYAGGALPGAIWEGKPCSYAAKAIVDGLIYALITGALFGKFWPHG
jgi:hypothetical protein